MAEKNNATCSICDSEYYVCLSCQDSMKLHPWKIHCCSPSHFQVFQIIRGLSTGVYTKDEAKEKFQNVNIEDLYSFRPHIKKIVKDIIKEEKPVVKIVEEISKVESTEVIDVDIKKEIVVEDVKNGNVESIDKSNMFYKKNYKVKS